jgi:membrane protease subunit (stomatin/prohibitin family)
MGMNNVVFLEVIEWVDQVGNELLHRVPETGSGEIKYGAQLTIRESQAGVFFYRGRAVHIFGPGRHTLKTANIPILNKILSIPWGMTSPLRAEVYFVNMKIFTNQKWGTRDPVAFKDEQLGLVRLRAFGLFNVRVLQPLLFINSLVGAMSEFTTSNIEEYLSSVIVSRLNDYLGGNLKSLVDLPGKYDEMATNLTKTLQEDFSHFGLGLTQLYINSITPPQDVQKAIDDKSKLGLFKNLNDLMQLKTANAIEKAAENPGNAGAAMGAGMGMMMPAMFMQQYRGTGGPASEDKIQCHECNGTISANSQFCPLCGHQLVIFSQCVNCGKNLPPSALFCPRCGTAVSTGPQKKKCAKCGYDNLHNSVFCNQCGERLP